MAEILPFRGVLYDPAKVGDVARVVAPPYDVIDAGEQTMLYARHPNNIIRLELGQEQAGDGPENNRYTRAKGFLNDWLANGIFRRDDNASIYVYSIEYPLRAGEVRTMRGFLSLAKLEDFGTGRVFPHENTRAAAKSDRYQLLEACRSNVSPIYSLYSDPRDRILGSLLKAVDPEKPVLDIVDAGGLRHRFWNVTEQAVLSQVVALIKPLPLFIADGHHRYESALAYAKSQREQFPRLHSLASDYVLMYLANLDDPGLTILPTHRLIPGPLPCEMSDLRRGLTEHFSLQTFPFTKDTEPGIRQRFRAALQAARSTNAHTMGLFARGETRYDLLTLTAAGEAKLGPSARDQLDVSILQQLVLRHAMRMTPEDEERLVYVKDEDETLDTVGKGEAELGILLNPPKITEVKDVARAGERMPHKSTYFYPKPLTGLVINIMDERRA